MYTVKCNVDTGEYLSRYSQAYDNSRFRMLSTVAEVWLGAPGSTCPQYTKDIARGGPGKAHHCIIMLYLRSADALCMGDMDNYYKLLAKRNRVGDKFPEIADYGEQFLKPFRRVVAQRLHNESAK